MGDPIDLKLLMNPSMPAIMTSSTSATTNPKAYKCCNATYTDKMYYDLHKQTHHKDLPVVQIVNLNPNQVIPQPAHQQQQQQQQPQQPQQQALQATPIVIPEDQLANYKRMYGVDSQIYTITPVTQYQVINANRGGTVTMTQSQPGQILQSYAPAYVVTTNDGQQQIHTIQDQSLDGQSQIHPQQTIHLQQQQVQTQVQHQQQHPQTQQQHTTVQEPIQQQHSNAPTTFTPTPRGSRTVIKNTKHRPYKCNQCTASFIEPDELEEHQKKHTGDGPFTCEDCHFTFMYKSHFRSHKTRCLKKRAMMPQPPKTIIMQPPSIKRTFPTNQMMENSAKSNQGNNFVVAQSQFIAEKANSTRQSGNRQTNKSQDKFNPNNPSFKRIKKERRLDRPFECEDCDASFQNELDLKNHKSKHTGEGPFKCEECRFVFLYRKLYEAHRRRCEKKRKEILVSTSVDPSTLATISTQSSVVSELPQTVVAQSNDMQNHAHQQQIEIEQQPVDISANDNSVTFASPVHHMHSSVGQNSVIEMRAIGQHGEVQHIQVPHQAVVEQLVVNSGGQSAAIGDRQDIKYDIIPVPVSSVDAVNVSQIMNLIKVKGSNH